MTPKKKSFVKHNMNAKTTNGVLNRLCDDGVPYTDIKVVSIGSYSTAGGGSEQRFTVFFCAVKD